MPLQKDWFFFFYKKIRNWEYCEIFIFEILFYFGPDVNSQFYTHQVPKNCSSQPPSLSFFFKIWTFKQLIAKFDFFFQTSVIFVA